MSTGEILAHTPGPWHVYDRGIGWEVHAGPVPSDGNHWWHADEAHPESGECRDITSDGFRETISSEANARLIAAAPELLAALQQLLTAHGEGKVIERPLNDSFWVPAREAIAKARGTEAQR